MNMMKIWAWDICPPPGEMTKETSIQGNDMGKEKLGR